MEETGRPGENHRPVASHRQTLSPYIYVVLYQCTNMLFLCICGKLLHDHILSLRGDILVHTEVPVLSRIFSGHVYDEYSQACFSDHLY